jgi:hypothetical protein
VLADKLNGMITPAPIPFHHFGRPAKTKLNRPAKYPDAATEPNVWPAKNIELGLYPQTQRTL